MIDKLVNYFKRKYYVNRLKVCGKNFRTGVGSFINNAQYVSIGNDFFTGPRFYLSTNSYTAINIGHAVMLGPEVMILGGNHDIKYKVDHMRYNSKAEATKTEIRLENGVWLGARVIVVSGGKIGEGSVIAAGSIVSKEIPPYSVYIGAKGLLKPRFNREELKQVLENAKSKYTVEAVLKAQKNAGLIAHD